MYAHHSYVLSLGKTYHSEYFHDDFIANSDCKARDFPRWDEFHAIVTFCSCDNIKQFFTSIGGQETVNSLKFWRFILTAGNFASKVCKHLENKALGRRFWARKTTAIHNKTWQRIWNAFFSSSILFINIEVNLNFRAYNLTLFALHRKCIRHHTLWIYWIYQRNKYFFPRCAFANSCSSTHTHIHMQTLSHKHIAGVVSVCEPQQPHARL